MEDVIRKHVLQNAVLHGGAAKAETVISKVLADEPALRERGKEVAKAVKKIVLEINKMPPEEQAEMLAKLAPETLAKKERVQREGLPPLPHAVAGTVVTRFPPEPNGYPHIGHAKAAVIDEQYARMYGGRFILRFDDTNPAKEKLEYYGAISDGLGWLGITPDAVKNTSDDMEIIYGHAKRLIDAGHAYVCTCAQQTVKERRASGAECACRRNSASENARGWEKMFSGFRQNEATLRLKGDMRCQNMVMRDPTLFRIIDTPHPLCNTRYRVWPTYDFSVVVEDRIDGVTHAMRTKEYELRDELYNTLAKLMGIEAPAIVEFARLDMEGAPVAKRKLKPLVDSGSVRGWDDPRLPTLAGLRRRGFLPAAIRNFVLSLGVTKSEAVMTWDTLESFNRKLLDPVADRYYFVADPVECRISGAPDGVVEIPLHPQHPERGSKRYALRGEGMSVWVSGDDAALLAKGKKVRLMHLFNVVVRKRGRTVDAEYAGNEKSDAPKIHWSPMGGARATLLVPDKLFTGEEFNRDSLRERRGVVEPAAASLKAGAHVQFERMGFARLDAEGTFILTHG